MKYISGFDANSIKTFKRIINLRAISQQSLVYSSSSRILYLSWYLLSDLFIIVFELVFAINILYT